MTSQLQERIKIACAVAVAAGIYRDIEKRPNDAYRLHRLRIASDAVDRTGPTKEMFTAYKERPEGEVDAVFLLKHFDKLMLIPPAVWPAYKIRPREWGEYTRVMKGLDAFLRVDLNTASFSKEERHNVKGMLEFVARVHDQLPEDITEALLAQLALQH